MALSRRFYKTATVSETEDGYAIALDGKVLRTPAKASLCLRSRALAEAIAEEWLAQGETIKPSSMPLMQLVSTAIDRVGPRRAEVTVELLRHAETDLLFYRADSPRELRERQDMAWQPVLSWAEAHLGIEARVTTGVMPIEQDPATLSAVADWLDKRDDLALAANAVAAAALGSMILAVAITERRLSAAEAFALSQLDENYQAELWGEDDELQLRRHNISVDVAAADRLLGLIRNG